MHAEQDFLQHRPDTFHPGLVPAFEYSPAVMESISPGCNLARLLGSDFPIAHRRLKQGDLLFRAGGDFHSLHVLNAGFAKTSYVSEDGRERTTGFHLRGDILGLDAVATGTYECDAIALDISDVLSIPYDALIARGQRDAAVARELHRAFGSEIRSDREQMLSMGSLHAEGRVAAFLLEMSRRFGSRGFSATKLQLRLTRNEIGSLIGLKLETVSRALSRFARLGIINVHLREIELLDRDALRDVVAMSQSH
ncbi:MAG: helix-turn-helix domain-containing protein [Betaproteobacteria bacterium]|nr:helix-turn-helix domain-containing protein [Betaproteobacteria bacterium]